MEEHSSYLSLYICRQILQNTVLCSVVEETERLSSVLNVFSYKQSENLSNAMISTSNYFHGNPQNRFTEDTPTQTLEKKTFKVRQTRKLQQKSKSTFVTYRKGQSKILANLNLDLHSAQAQRLVPLKVQDQQSINEGEQDQFQEKMRQMKVHQQYVRSRYAQNMRQSNKKMLSFHKMDAKVAPKVPIYDYDGSLVAPLKPDAQRFPVHYLELEVNVQDEIQKQEKMTQSKNKKVVKAKNIVKFDESVKKQTLKPLYSSFLKDLSNVQWVQGVELQSNKEECRKILGYSYNQLSQKKKLDLFKTSQAPVKLKLQQLQNYKTLMKRSSQSVIQRKSITKKNISTKTILTKEDTRIQFDTGSKTIQVANNRALQFLIREDEDPQAKKKQSGFANAKSAHNRTPQPSYLRLLKSNVSVSVRDQLHKVGKKAKVVINSKLNSQSNL